MKKYIYLLIIFYYCSCSSFNKYKSIISQREDYIWIGKTDQDTYLFQINSNDNIWFEGILIKNHLDTAFIKGFEKGNDHPSYIIQNQLVKDSIYSNSIFIWSRGIESDTIEINNVIEKEYPDNGIPNHLILIKVPKPE